MAIPGMKRTGSPAAPATTALTIFDREMRGGGSDVWE
jgi:hypothetical protein